ncbi:MAG: mandelate racemase/muconate lactonizing enzyme family protein [Nitrososphaerales archaeon]
MKITEAKTFFLKVPLERAITDSINSVAYIGLPVVRLTSDKGTQGWGFCWQTAGGGEFVKEMMDRYMVKTLLGKDPAMRKRLVNDLFFVENFGWDFRLGRNGLAVMAVSAIDIALWDLLCKDAGMPLWGVLGGYNERVQAYDTNGGWLSWSTEELVANSKKLVSEGYRAIKMKVGSADPADDYSRLGAVRAAVGSSVKLMIDANTKWDLDTAMRWGRRFDDFSPFWFEEPINPLDIRGHATLRKRIETPIAVGESIHNRYTFRDYIVQEAVDIIQVDATKVAGITEWVEVASMADAFNIPVYPHTNIQQPVHVQLVAASRNASVVENVPWLLDVWEHPSVPKDGYFELPSEPGAGSEVREDAIARYSFSTTA